uniref:Uncharacterized protein n=1 Tax=Rhizophora mucronata TaxID=61149 RepID=A0A2P2P1F1_RHIMU
MPRHLNKIKIGRADNIEDTKLHLNNINMHKISELIVSSYEKSLIIKLEVNDSNNPLTDKRLSHL